VNKNASPRRALISISQPRALRRNRVPRQPAMTQNKNASLASEALSDVSIFWHRKFLKVAAAEVLQPTVHVVPLAAAGPSLARHHRALSGY